jgi:hypothetical protein
MADLKPANRNPWYILMTLYGEQEGDEIDWDLHEKNRAAWNAWACQGMGAEARDELARKAGLDVKALRAWQSRKDEIAREFETVWTARNGAGQACPLLPVPGAGIDLRGIAFSNTVVLEKAIFSGFAWFDSAQFSGDARFTSAQFSGIADFDSAQFSGIADFDSAQFSRDAKFNEVQVSAFAKFNGVQFSRNAWFDSAQFNGDTEFYSTQFSGVAWFASAQFSGFAWFGSAQFSGFAYFPDATFGADKDGTGAAVFTDCQFEKPTSFRGARFLKRYPEFSGAVLHQNTAFTAEDANWPTGPQDDPKEARASCAVIRHSLGKQGLPEEEHFFYRREMGFAGQIGGWWQRLPYRAFGVLSEYGYSILKPCLWLLGLWLVPALIYMAYFNWPGVAERMNAIDGVTLGKYDSVSLSFVSMFNFLGLHRIHFGADYYQALAPFIQLLTATQTVFGVILLFFLGLGLRTRFRLR